jgi:2'-5' RNA ligase
MAKSCRVSSDLKSQSQLISDLQHGPSETIVAELRDYPEWQRGRQRYAVWIIPVDDPVLLDYIDVARQRLADLLHPALQRQPHLTLFVCGFEQPTRIEDDDFLPAQLHAQIESLQGLRSRTCELPLGAPDSFASAAYIAVNDPAGQLSQWRNALGLAANEVRQAPYVPHITLGLYKRKATAAEIRRRLRELDPPPTPLRINQLHYVTYEASQQFGPLETEHIVSLASNDAMSVPPVRLRTGSDY